jgi:hypothetical protein
MIFLITYLTEYQFWQGYAVFCWCLVVLLLHFTYARQAHHALVVFFTLFDFAAGIALTKPLLGRCWQVFASFH